MTTNQLAGFLRRCVDDYNMIEEGDSVAVGVSGGKDSLTLLTGLAHLRTFYPKAFELKAVSLHMGFEDMDFSGVADLCRRLAVPYTLKQTRLKQVIFDERREKNPCALCAKMRRGALHDLIKELGCNKIALGHHFDDAVETFMLSLTYEGRISCFQPVTWMSRAGVTQIRPLLYVGEGAIRAYAEREGLPVVFNPCPHDGRSKRQDAKELLKSLDGMNPGIKDRIFGAMRRLPLEGWGVNEGEATR